MVTVCLHAYYALASARHQFETDAARTRKQVEGIGSLKVEITAYHVKNILLRHVGCGACLESAGYVEMTALVNSRYNSQSPKV